MRIYYGGARAAFSYLVLPCLVIFCFQSEIFSGPHQDLGDIKDKFLPSIVVIRVGGKGAYKGKLSPVIIPKVGLGFLRKLVRVEAHKNGMGLIVDADGLIVTNAHTLSGLDKVDVVLHDGKELTGSVAWVAPKEDLAIVAINTEDRLKSAIFGDSDFLKLGDPVFAVINRENKDMIEMAASWGSVIGLKQLRFKDNKKAIFSNFIKTDIILPYGSSGGPLVDKQGRLVGMNVAGSSTGKVSYAIPSNNVKAFFNRYLKERAVAASGS